MADWRAPLRSFDLNGTAHGGQFPLLADNASQSDSEVAARQRDLIEKLSLTFHGLSHDLREPLRTILCYGDILGGSPAVKNDPNLTECVHFISGAAHRVEELVNGLLDYSRLLGAQPHPRAVVDMNLIVQTALANLHLKIEESGATIVNDSLPAVLGDAVQLSELIQNLLANSIKYRGEAPPQILIRAERHGQEHVFSVEDNGIGVDPAQRESIFMPFRRLHGSELPGAGLGLTICRHIVDSHGGRIWVESTGKGSSFRFVLPAAEE
jgi:light-regulated signal transduction histidine kinase (bacteriophytochrome)